MAYIHKPSLKIWNTLEFGILLAINPPDFLVLWETVKLYIPYLGGFQC